MAARPSASPLDATSLSHLLARLAEDADRAGLEYERLRHALLRFFDWRGVATSDVATDETLDRLARRLAAGEDVKDVRAFALGIARLVAFEQHRQTASRHEPFDPSLAERLAAPPPAADDPRRRCFDACMDGLAADARDLIVTYYTHTGRARIDARADLARRLDLSANALRLRAQRVRDRLEACVNRCLQAAGPPVRSGGAP